MKSKLLTFSRFVSRGGNPWLILGLIALMIMFLLDIFYLRGRIFNKEIPSLTPSNVLRSAITLGSMTSIFYGLYKNGRSFRIKYIMSGSSVKRWTTVGSILLAVFLICLFLLEPGLFSRLSLEDEIVEWGSFTFLMLGFGLFFLSALKMRKKGYTDNLVVMGLFLISMALFVIGMEEISWFQRVLGFQTPELFEGNWQGEMNLHNFSTNWAENAYYFGAFAFLVLLPLIHMLYPKIFRFKKIYLMVPSTYVAICASIPFAYNYSMWNTLLIQISFFGSIAVLLTIFILTDRHFEKQLIAITLTLLLLTQILFLMNGHLFMRDWEVTEYKELLIPIVFVIYWFDLQYRWRLASNKELLLAKNHNS